LFLDLIPFVYLLQYRHLWVSVLTGLLCLKKFMPESLGSIKKPLQVCSFIEVSPCVIL